MDDKKYKIYGSEHIGVIVSDIVASKHFYCDILGMEVVYEKVATVPAGKIHACFVKLGNITLDLEQYPEFPEGKGEGLIDHICFGVKNLEEAIADLRSKGVQFTSDEAIKLPDFFRNGIQFIFFRGPDNEMLELAELF